MLSRNFTYCNGIILFAGYVGGFAHHGALGTPRVYVPEMINQLGPFGDIEAVLVGGDEELFRRNEGILAHYEIPVVAHFLDRWPDMLMTSEAEKMRFFQNNGAKDVLAIPSMREVLMFTERKGYVKLL